jgi:hypothetical protein
VHDLFSCSLFTIVNLVIVDNSRFSFEHSQWNDQNEKEKKQKRKEKKNEEPHSQTMNGRLDFVDTFLFQ